MKSSYLTNWNGTKRELMLIVDFRVSKIMEYFSVDCKTARKLFCESLLRNLVVSEMDDMIDYIINDSDD